MAAEVVGEIETDVRVMLLRRIHLTYHLRVEPDRHATAERVLSIHAAACPLARSISGCVEITPSLELDEPEDVP